MAKLEQKTWPVMLTNEVKKPKNRFVRADPKKNWCEEATTIHTMIFNFKMSIIDAASILKNATLTSTVSITSQLAGC